MGQQDTLELLKELGGEATLATLTEHASYGIYKHYCRYEWIRNAVCDDLKKLKRWKAVENPKRGLWRLAQA